MDALTLETLKTLAHGLAVQFGPNCEIVIHDLTGDVDHSVVAIENGTVTGRKLGDGPSHVVLEALREQGHLIQDHLAYLTRTKDGKILKSSTLYIRNAEGKPVAIFAINYDITMMLSMENTLRDFTAVEQSDKKAEPEEITKSVGDLLDELITQSVDVVGKPVAMMTKEDKVRAIQFLNGTGAFLITKSGDKVCKFFGISKYTLYSYMDEK